MNVEIGFNDQRVTVDHAITLVALLALRGLETRSGIAVAVNNEVIPRAEWSQFTLKHLDQVLVITAAQGG